MKKKTKKGKHRPQSPDNIPRVGRVLWCRVRRRCSAADLYLEDTSKHLSWATQLSFPAFWWFLFDVCLIYDTYGVLDSKTGELGWGVWDQVISTELHIARASFRQPHAITTFKAISHAWAGWGEWGRWKGHIWNLNDLERNGCVWKCRVLP